MLIDLPENLMAKAKQRPITREDQLPTGFMENVEAAYDLFRSEDSSDSKTRHWKQQLSERAQAIESFTGEYPEWHDDIYRGTVGDPEQRDPRIYERAQEKLAAVRQKYPEIKSDDELRANIPLAAAEIRQHSESIMARADGWGGQMVGTLGAATLDPLNIAFMMVTLPAAGSGAINTLAKVARAAKFGAGVGLATELAIQPSVFQFKKELGVDYGIDDAAINIAASTIGSGLLMGVGEVAKPIARSGARTAVEAYKKFFVRRPDLVTPDTSAAMQVLEEIADVLESNPLTGGAEAQNAHVQGLAKAVEDLQSGRRVDVADIVRDHEQAVTSFIPRALADDDPRLKPTNEITTKERQALRQQIIESKFKDVTPVTGRKPIAYVVAGGSGAGKRTLLKSLQEGGVIPKKGALRINPDEIKTELDEFKELVAMKEGRAAQVVHRESVEIADAAYGKGLAENVDMVIDRVLGKPEKAMAMIDSLKKAGYDVRMFGVAIDPSEAARRSIIRGKKKGRFVPIGEMVTGHRGFATGFDRYADAVDEVRLFDNTGKQFKQVARKKPGEKLEVQDKFEYDKFINRRFPDDLSIQTKGTGARDAGPDRIQRTADEGGQAAGRRPDADTSPLAGGRRLDPNEINQAELDEVNKLLDDLGEDFEIPTDVRVTDASGKLEVTTRSAREILKEINEKESTLENIIKCVAGGAGG